MANKICIVPLSLDKDDSSAQNPARIATRIISAFATSKRGKSWYESVEWNLISKSSKIRPNIRKEFN